MAEMTSAEIAEQLKSKNFARAQQKLERSRARIEPALNRLLGHRNAFVRELAATILGERRRPESIPALIEAVGDRSEYVAFDAIVAIEKCAGFEPGQLVNVLKLDFSKPRAAAKRLEGWWRLVRRDVLD